MQRGERKWSQMRGLNFIAHENIVLAKLYDTVVARIDSVAKVARLTTGGFATKATCKAINLALEEACFAGRVKLIKGSVVYVEERGMGIDVVDETWLRANELGHVVGTSWVSKGATLASNSPMRRACEAMRSVA